jgi:F1F0 ATPase subunit 2
MNIFLIASRLVLGVALGIFFYAGLWFTVKRLSHARHPALLTLGSFWARTIIVLAGFVALIEHSWQYALAVFAGFIAGRLLTSQFLILPRAAAK